MAQLATASQMASLVLGTAHRQISAPLASQPEAKPFEDWITRMDACWGEASRAPEALLDQFRLCATQNSALDTERVRQSIARSPARPSSGAPSRSPTTPRRPPKPGPLRKASGQEYAAIQALLAMFHVNAQPTQSASGAQRAPGPRPAPGEVRVPSEARPADTRFSRVKALSPSLDEELNPFLGAVGTHCRHPMLRGELEEADDQADTGCPSLARA